MTILQAREKVCAYLSPDHLWCCNPCVLRPLHTIPGVFVRITATRLPVKTVQQRGLCKRKCTG